MNVPASRLDSLGVDAINVATNGSVAAVEQARTMLENAYAYPSLSAPSTIGDLIAQDDSTNNAYQQLANTVILVSLPIAGCTLAAAIAAGLADRKRPFSLLRLTGARLATLRRVVALESAVPLLAVAAVAIGTGFAAAAEYASRGAGLPDGGARRRVLPHHRGRDPGRPSASSRPPSRCWPASPDPRSRETNERRAPVSRAGQKHHHTVIVPVQGDQSARVEGDAGITKLACSKS